MVEELLHEDATGASPLDGGLAALADRTLEREAPLSVREIGPYLLLGAVGEGAMGVVYLPERTDLGSKVAIKLLRDATLSPMRRDRFLSEQRILAQLQHPFIAQIHDAGQREDGTLWFAMEYIDGIPLTEFVMRERLQLAERLKLFRSVCEAVQHAHRHAVIHRDLKPSNILVTADRTVKLLDFGIAKQLEPDNEASDATRTGLQLMTPAYAAPERFTGGRVGVFTDVYSLGVILYELLTGALPFRVQGRTAGEIERAVLQEEAERPSVAASRMGTAVSASRSGWADLDVLCQTAMHKDPQRRYRTVDALLRDVNHFLSGEPLDARPDAIGYRLGKLVRRRWRGLAAATLLVAAAATLVTFYSVRLAQARNAAVADASRAERIQAFTLSLFDGGDPEAGPPDSLRVTTLLQRGRQEADQLAAEPLAQAGLYATLGGIHRKLGDLDRADTLISLALDRTTKRAPTASAEAVRLSLALGELRMDQARLEDASVLVRTAAADARAPGARNPRLLSQALASLGRLHELEGRYDSAIAVLDTARQLARTAGVGELEVASLTRAMADAHFYAGHYDVADSINRELLELQRERRGARHPAVAGAFVNLSAIAFEKGDYAGSERFAREALEITRDWYGLDHPETASGMTQLARALVYQSKFAEAVSLLDTALAVQERLMGPVHPRVASALNELGNVALGQGDFRAAERHFRRMADIYRSIHGEDHYLLATALSNVASVYQREGRNRDAEPIFRDVVQRYTASVGPDHLYTGIARIKLGRSLLRQGSYAEAIVESQAGHDIVAAQADPAVSFLNAARADLDTARMRQ